MDEHFNKNKRWIGLGALAIIFLCLALCGFGAMASMFLRSAPGYGVAPGAAPYVQPPAAEEGVPVPPVYQGYSPLGMGRHVHGGPLSFIGGAIGMLFKLAFFGLLLLLLIGLVKRMFWGPRHWGAYHGGKPPRGKGKPHGHWGPPWTWHGACPPWEAEAKEPASVEDEPDSDEADSSKAAYAGPQE